MDHSVLQSKPRVLFPAVAIVLVAIGAAGMAAVALHALTGLDPHVPGWTLWLNPTFEEATRGNPQRLYESYRVLFFHVPAALATALMSGVMGLGGLLFFISRHERYEALIVAAAQTGLVACLLVITTGYFWGDYAWGMGWTWEPRLNAALVLWLSYLALLMLRRAVDNRKKRAVFTAAYALLTVPLYPLTSQAIRLFGNTSHPAGLEDLIGNDNPVGRLLNFAKPAIGALFLGLMVLRYWQVRVADKSEALSRRLEDLRGQAD